MRHSIAVATVVLTTACGGEKKAAPDTTAAAPPPAAAPAPPTAAVVIVSPAEGDSTGADVTVVMRKEGVAIEKASGTRVEGVGHYHLFLDTPPSAEGQPIPPTTKSTVHIGTGDSTYTFKGLTPGKHQIIAVIGYGDHVPMPSRHDTVNIVVKK